MYNPRRSHLQTLVSQNVKHIKFFCQHIGFKAQNAPKSAPDPAGGSLRRSPDPLVGWGGNSPSPPQTPSASLLDLAAFGASFLTS